MMHELGNQFTFSGLVLLFAGSALALLRDIPSRLMTIILNQTTCVLTVQDTDPSFEWFKRWILDQNFTRTIRRIDLSAGVNGSYTLGFLPAPGNHFFFHNRRPFWYRYTRTEESKGYANKRSENISLRTLGRNRNVLLSISQQSVEVARTHNQEIPRLRVYSDSYWREVGNYSPRTWDSMILPDKDRMLNRLCSFAKAKDRYRALGIPYHFGLLLYGPPGTGKTSLVSALAAELRRTVYILNLGELSDKSLKTALSLVPPNSLVLFEDIDASTGNRIADEDDDEEDARSSVTLSALLNVLDGLTAPDGVIYAMTTNHIDRLDPALIRPGRIDLKLYMGPATEAQKVELFIRFKGHNELNKSAWARIRQYTDETMASFQGWLLEPEPTSPSVGD